MLPFPSGEAGLFEKGLRQIPGEAEGRGRRDDRDCGSLWKCAQSDTGRA